MPIRETSFIDCLILGICLALLVATAFAHIVVWTADRQAAQPIPCGVAAPCLPDSLR